jgi:uncharacterized cofD-like protein
MKKIVVIGGGTGLSTLLRGLKKHDLDITAVVTMTDNGASTGRLRRDMNMLPPGDIRKCIAALSDDEGALLDLFNYRFKNGFGLSGHSLGNLLLTAMSDLTGSFDQAVERMEDLLNVRGKVLPATLKSVHLGAEFADGRRVMGETNITKYGYAGKRIKKLFLDKEAASNPKVLKSIKEADVILIGPGSLYTSLIPNFLHKDLLSAYQNSKASKIYICNVSTERGETDGFKVSDHIAELEKYFAYHDKILVNNTPFPEGSGDGYVRPVMIDVKKPNVVGADIVQTENPLFHHSEKLASAIIKML